jgi:hypothetical protein
MNRALSTTALLFIASTARGQAAAPPADAAGATGTLSVAASDAPASTAPPTAPADPNAGTAQGQPATASPAPETPASPARAAETAPPQANVAPAQPSPSYSIVGPPGPKDVRPEPPRGPVTQHFQIGLNLDVLISSNASLDVFTDDDSVSMPGVSAAYAFWLDDALSIQPEIGYSGMTQDSNDLLGGAIGSAEWEEHTGYLGVSGRYELWGFFAPHVRLSGGLSRTIVTVQTSGGDPNFEDASWLPHVALGGGATVTTPDGFFRRGSSFAVGLTIEGGYRLGSPMEVALSVPDAEDRIPIEQASLGDLSRSGPYVRVSGVVRF